MSSIKYEIHLLDGGKMTCIDPTGDTPEQAIAGFCRDFAHRRVTKVEYHGKTIEVSNTGNSNATGGKD